MATSFQTAPARHRNIGQPLRLHKDADHSARQWPRTARMIFAMSIYWTPKRQTRGDRYTAVVEVSIKVAD